MKPQEFILWLKGFVAAVEETPTKGQWETIVSELNKTQEYPNFKSSISDDNIVRGWENSWEDPCGIVTNSNTSWTTVPKGANITYTLTNDSKNS